MKIINYKSLLLSVAGVLFCSALQAQPKSKPVLKIGNQSFQTEEFDYIYNKNNPGSLNPMTQKEYLNLFVNYKLKVKAAEDAGLDTVAAFKSELEYYRNELAKPYLTDRKAEEDVVSEAYERLKYDIDASHILVMARQDATPADTLKAWEKIKKAEQEIIGGADFAMVAQKYSEDPSVRNNSGRLGWFTAFQMVYPFESEAYKTAVDGLSKIVRTSYGYHLIKVHGKRQSSGEILVAHIMKTFPQNATQEQIDRAKQSIDSIGHLIQSGEDFATLASAYSDDQQSAVAGGELPWFSKGRMIESFANQAFALKENGDISESFRTPFGWHIVKRIDYKPIGTLDEERDNILEHLTYDDRSQAGVKTLVAHLKKEYSFRNDTALLSRLITLIKGASNDSVAKAEAALLQGNLYSFGPVKRTIAEFASRLADAGMLTNRADAATIAKIAEKESENDILEYEKSHLEQKYPEFRFLMMEYHDGLLVFEISQQKIWNRAASDTLGLNSFYSRNIDRYSENQTFTGKILKFGDAKAVKTFAKKLETNKMKAYAQISSRKDITINEGRFVKGENASIDNIVWPASGSKDEKVITEGTYMYDTPIPLEKIKGTVISDYQEYLEKEWIKELHSKYGPRIYNKNIK